MPLHRIRPLVTLALLGVVSGCNCRDPESEARLSIVSPTSGTQFNRADDLRPDIDGVQVAVALKAVELDGRSVKLEGPAGTASPVTVQAGAASMELTLTRSGGIQAMATDADGNLVRSGAVELVFDEAASACRITAPSDGSTLGAADDAEPASEGFQHAVRVRCVGVDLGETVSLRVNGALLATTPLDAGGVAVFSAIELLEGENELVVQAGEVTERATVTVETGACRVVLEPSSGSVFSATGEAGAIADLIPGAPMDARLWLSTDCPGGAYELRSGDVVVARVEAGIEKASTDLKLDDGSVELRAYLLENDAVRGVGVLTRYTVDSVMPSVSVDFPLEGAALDAESDESTEEGLQVSVRGAFTGIDAGSAFEVELVTDEGEPQSFTGTVEEDGAFSLPVTLSDGAHSVVVSASRASGATARSEKISFTSLHAPAPLAFVTPRDGASLSLADDADTDAEGFQLVVKLKSEGFAGREGTLVCDGVSSSFTLGSDGTVELTRTLNVNSCAGRVLGCSARIEDDGTSIDAEPVSVLVDPVPPEVLLVSPLDGTALDTALVHVSATTSCVGEEQSVVVMRGEEIVAGPEAVLGNVLQVGPVALAPGETLLSLRVSDAGGNVSETPISLFVDTTVPAPVFVEPEPAELVVFGVSDDADLSNGLQRVIRVEVPNESVGTLVELRVAGRAPLAARTVDESGRLVAVYESVSLPEGSFELRACATDEAGSVGCALQAVKVDTGRPVCDVLSPADGHALGARDDMDPNTVGVQTEVVVRTSAEDGTFVTVQHLDALGNASTASAGVSGGEARLPGMTFGEEGAHTLSAVCRSESGIEGRSLPNGLVVDFTPPVAEILEPADGAVFSLSSIDSGVAEGFQIDIRVRSNEASFGALAFLSIQCGEGPVAVAPVQVNTLNEATFRAVTMPDEAFCTLSVEIEDAAGNRSEPVEVDVHVDRVAPVVTLTQPVDGALFGSSADADLALDGFQLASVRAEISGTFEAESVTLAVGTTQVNGGSVSSGTGGLSASWSQVSLGEGVNELVVTALDEAGNVGEGRVRVTVDTLAPVVYFVGISNGVRFRATSDVDSSTPGLQRNIQLGGERIIAGTAMKICSPEASAVAPACLGGSGRVLGSGVWSGTSLVLSNVTLPEGQVELYAEATTPAGNTARSASLTVFVDSAPPVVSELVLSKHDDTLLATSDSANVLLGREADSSATRAGFQARVKVKLEGLEPGASVVFTTTNPLPNTVLGPAVFVDAEGRASLDVTLADGGHQIRALASDSVGNTSVSTLVLSLAVDMTPPRLAIVDPRPGALLVKDDVSASLAGLQFDVRVDSDAGAGRPVEVLLDGTALATVTLPSNTVRMTIPEGVHSLTARVKDAAGNETVSAPVQVKVDSIAPIVSVTMPQQNQVISTDADPVTNGFQLSVQVNYSQVEAGRILRLFSTTGGLLAKATTTAGGTAVFPPVTVPAGAQELSARVSDVSGNVTTSVPVRITVDTNAPSVRFVSPDNPLTFGLAHNAGDGTCLVGIEGLVDVASSVALLIDGVAAQTLSAEAGAFVFPGLVVTPGVPMLVQLRATDASSRVGYSAERPIVCDLNPPVVAFTQPAQSTVRYVAFGNPGAVSGALVDKIATPELEADFTVSVSGGEDTVLELVSSLDGVLASVDVLEDGVLSLESVRIPSSGTHVLTARVVDAAGNVGSASLTAHVDVQAPGAAVAQAEVVDARAGLVRLVFAAPGSDGQAGGPVSGYLVRRSSVTIDSEAAWTAATAVSLAPVTVSSPGAAQELILQGIALEREHWFAVRAIDDAGNLGALGSSPSVDLRMQRTNATAWSSGSAPSLVAQARFLVADIDGDGFDDIVSASNQAGVSIIYGGPILSEPVLLRAAGAGQFGSSLDAGDVNGDGHPDLLVGAQYETALDEAGVPVSGPDARDGALHVFLGAPNTRLTAGAESSAVIQGRVSSADLGTTLLFGFGFTAEVVEDLTGDGISDIVVGAPGDNGRRGAVYVIAGRQNWPSVVVAPTDAVGILRSGFTAANGPWFGHAIASLGDVDGDGAGDFALAVSGGTLSDLGGGQAAPRPVYIVSGALVSGSQSVETVSHAVYAVNATTRTVSGASNRFGAELVAGDFTGDGKRDLAVLDYLNNSFFLYEGAALSVPTEPGASPLDVSSSRLATVALPVDRGTGTPALSVWKDVSGDGIAELGAAFGATNSPNVAWAYFGRSPELWRSLTGVVATSILVERRDTSAASNHFGVRSGAGAILSSDGPADIALLSLGGRVTVLSGP